MTLYLNLAEELAARIEQGLFRPGERLPSVRTLSQEHGVSLSTVQQAYRQLEDQGLATPRPKSGYFVNQLRQQPELPQISRAPQRPVEVSQWEQVLELVSEPPSSDVLQLSRGIPDIDVPTLKPLLRSLSRLSRRQSLRELSYGAVEGEISLRQEVARLTLDSGCQLAAEDIVITTGCHEALSAALRAICQPGDIVAVDSPSFHGVMQALKGFGMKALELPTDPLTGISLEALEMALEQWPIKAIQLTPSCNNPLGYVMPEANKRALLALAQRFDVAIIEDDIYGDLAYHYPRPRSIKSFDEDGRVLLCSSFSKTLAPGLRIGWIAPGRYLQQVLHMKYMGTGMSAQLPQLAIAEFIRDGLYQPHLRQMRKQYARGREQMTGWVSRYFPPGTRVSQPQGGFMLWVEMPQGFDSLRLNRRLAASKLQAAPGSIFSAAGKYRNCIRLNFACSHQPSMEAAIRQVGETVTQLLAEDA
ncbi:GntR family transcriptional regulator [Ectopseudomonas mendocina DLHK]|nr:GntR family transcriptional regulator [Pseudomonas mendocina DLHK]